MSHFTAQMRRYYALVLLLASFLMPFGAQASDEVRPELEQELGELLELLSGDYTGLAPRGMTPGSETHQLVYHFRRVVAPQFGEQVIYYRVTSSTASGPILQAKLFIFSNEAARMANTMYALVLTQEQAEKIRANGATQWQSLNQETLMSFPPQCILTWARRKAGFVAKSSPECSYESKAFKQSITPRMRYLVSHDVFQLEETLLGEDGQALVSTGGLLTANRK